jgi:hypothetical protein
MILRGVALLFYFCGRQHSLSVLCFSYGFQPLSTKEDGGELQLDFTDESDQYDEDVLLDRNANAADEDFKTSEY